MNDVEIAKLIHEREIEARIDEIKINMTCDSERLNLIRIKQLQAELERVRDGK